ncbi:hypothetical protein BT93_B2980 [Corymbia citriodora subsp. variegata]|nr:hypothetical protein BT93_B2980 [Corymbia citriodora subsp. variegata]
MSEDPEAPSEVNRAYPSTFVLIYCWLFLILIVLNALSPWFSLAEILARYRNHSEEAEGSKDANKGCPSGESSLQSPSQLLQLVQRYVEGPDDDNVSVTDLVQLEEQLDAAIMQTRHRKTQLMMESVMTLQDQERLLREENELLEREIASLKANDESSNEATIRYHGVQDNQSVDQSQQATLNLLR